MLCSFPFPSLSKSCTQMSLTCLSGLLTVGHQSSPKAMPPERLRIPDSLKIHTHFMPSKPFLAMKPQLFSSSAMNCPHYHSQPASLTGLQQATSRFTTFPASIKQPKSAAGCHPRKLQRDNSHCENTLPWDTPILLWHPYKVGIKRFELKKKIITCK